MLHFCRLGVALLGVAHFNLFFFKILRNYHCQVVLDF